MMVIRRVLAARALRAFADGFIAVLLPAYLLALGLWTVRDELAAARGWVARLIALGPALTAAARSITPTREIFIAFMETPPESSSANSAYFFTLLASILTDGSSSLVEKAVSTANGFSMPR